MGAGASSAAVSPYILQDSVLLGNIPGIGPDDVKPKRTSLHDLNKYDIETLSMDELTAKIAKMGSNDNKNNVTLIPMLSSIIERTFPDIYGTFTSEIIANLTEIKLERGAVLVKQGEVSSHMYIVQAGTLLKINNATFVNKDNSSSNPPGNAHGNNSNLCTEGSCFVTLPEDDAAAEFIADTAVNRNALSFDFPAAMTLAASGDCIVYRLSRQVFKAVQKRAVFSSLDRCAERLKCVEEFDFLPESKLSALANSMSNVCFANGECLSTQGNPTNRLLIIESGFVQVEVDGNVVTDLGPLNIGLGGGSTASTAVASVAASSPSPAAAAQSITVSSTEQLRSDGQTSFNVVDINRNGGSGRKLADSVKGTSPVNADTVPSLTVPNTGGEGGNITGFTAYNPKYDILRTEELAGHRRVALDEASKIVCKLGRRQNSGSISRGGYSSARGSSVGGDADSRINEAGVIVNGGSGGGTRNGSPGIWDSTGTGVNERLSLIHPGCIIGLCVLRGRQGRAGAWEYVCYTNQYNQTVYGFKSPFTLRALGKVRAREITIQTFEAKVCRLAHLAKASANMGSPLGSGGGRSHSQGGPATTTSINMTPGNSRAATRQPPSSGGHHHQGSPQQSNLGLSPKLSPKSNQGGLPVLSFSPTFGVNVTGKDKDKDKEKEKDEYNVKMLAYQSDSTMGIIQTSLRSGFNFFTSAGPSFRNFDRMNIIKVLNSTSSCQTIHCTVADPPSFFIDNKKEKISSTAEVGSYVMKVYNKTAVLLEGRLDTVLNEAEQLAGVDSAFVSKLVWQFQTANSLCLVVDAIEYGDLFRLLHPPAGQVLFATGIPCELVQHFLASVLLGLRHMHSMGLVYRNLKPENVLIDGRGLVKLVGLDLSKRLPCGMIGPFGDLTESSSGNIRMRTFTLCGCLEYLAPEQILDSGHDTSVDMWALGVLAHELFLTCTPFVPNGHISCTISPSHSNMATGTGTGSHGSGGTGSGSGNGQPAEHLTSNIVEAPINQTTLPSFDHPTAAASGSAGICASRSSTASSPRNPVFDTEALLDNILAVQHTRFLVKQKVFRTHGPPISDLKTLIEDLLLFNPADRLVAARGFSPKCASFHVFFENFDWEALELGQYSAFYIPFRKTAEFSYQQQPYNGGYNSGTLQTSKIHVRDISGSQWSATSLTHNGGTLASQRKTVAGVVEECPIYYGDQSLFAAF